MINKNNFRFLIVFSLTLFAILAPYFYFSSKESNLAETRATKKAEHKLVPTRSIATIHRNIKKDKKPTYTITVDKKDVSAWESGLYKALLAQGKDNLSAIELVKESTYTWPIGQSRIQVESVRISLKNLKDEATSFRAMVDSRNGKILQTWDQTIEDPANPRERFGIKLDPRYLE